MDAFGKCADLKDVYYAGSRKDWENIEIEERNEDFIDAFVHYNISDPEGHYELVTTPPTCTKDGRSIEVCPCGHSKNELTIPATGHKYENGTCTVCGEAKPDVILGDAGGDGAVRIGDAITILKHVAGWQGITIDTDTADVDASGKVDLNDAILVLRKIAGWAVDF